MEMIFTAGAINRSRSMFCRAGEGDRDRMDEQITRELQSTINSNQEHLVSTSLTRNTSSQQLGTPRVNNKTRDISLQQPGTPRISNNQEHHTSTTTRNTSRQQPPATRHVINNQEHVTSTTRNTPRQQPGTPHVNSNQEHLASATWYTSD